MKRMLAPSLAALLLATSPLTAQKQFTLPESVEVIRDVEFGTGGGRPLKLHILRPKKESDRPMPVIVWIHGGGWSKGHRDSGISRLAPFAAKGYFCASAEYRLSGEAKFPAQIEDCKCAIRFLRAHAAKYNIDPARVGVWGSSAGGHLVSLLGTSGAVKALEGKGGWDSFSSSVQAVCDFCGPSDFFRISSNSKGDKGPVAALFGGAVDDKKDLALLASPITHIAKGCPPFLIVHGEVDNVVPMEQAKLLHDALRKAGVSVRLFVAERQGHGLGGPQVMQEVEEFFDRTLKK